MYNNVCYWILYVIIVRYCHRMLWYSVRPCWAWLVFLSHPKLFLPWSWTPRAALPVAKQCKHWCIHWKSPHWAWKTKVEVEVRGTWWTLFPLKHSSKWTMIFLEETGDLVIYNVAAMNLNSSLQRVAANFPPISCCNKATRHVQTGSQIMAKAWGSPWPCGGAGGVPHSTGRLSPELLKNT